MNILLVHQFFLENDEGGGSRFNEMTRCWAGQGHNVTVLAGMVHYTTGIKREEYKGKYYVRKKHSPNVEVYRCHVSDSYNVSFLGRFWAYFSFVFSSIFVGFFKLKGKYDLVLVTSPPLFVGISGYIISRLKRIPLVFEVRDLWPESAIDTGVIRNSAIIRFSYWFEGFIYRKSKLINTLTPAFKRKLIEEKNVPEEKVVMIPNAADFTIAEKVAVDFDVAAFRKQLGIDNKFVVIYVGAHGIANHLVQVVQTADLLRDEQVVFLMIGDGMEKQKLMAEAKRQNLDNMMFLGSQPKEKVFEYILASNAGASVLKKNDTFKTVYSNKTFDYMSCKIPVLMAIDGVSKELVEDACCGVFVEPENPEDFADKVRFFMDNKHKIREWGENGYHYARANFSRDKLAMDYLNAVEEVLGTGLETKDHGMLVSSHEPG